jgi:hypothetical protein
MNAIHRDSWSVALALEFRAIDETPHVKAEQLPDARRRGLDEFLARTLTTESSWGRT